MRAAILRPDVIQLSSNDREEVAEIANSIRINGFTELEEYVKSMSDVLVSYGFDRKDVRNNLGQEGISVPSWVPNPNPK